MTDAQLDAFEGRFAAHRWSSDAAALAAAFTADEVGRYVTAAAAADRPEAPYVVRAFPAECWGEAALGLLDREVGPGEWSVVHAAFERAPGIFAAEPWRIFRFVPFAAALPFWRAHDEAVRSGLARLFRDATCRWRWQAAGTWLRLEPAAALEVAGALAAEPDPAAARWALLECGWTAEDGVLRRLWPDTARHLLFPDGYRPHRDHPTWSPATVEPADHAFGGRVAGLHHVLTLDPVPPGVGVSLRRLVLAIDLDASYDESSEQYFRHRADGAIVPATDAAPVSLPAFVATRVRLARTPTEWEVQDWGRSNGGENLFRLGGPPVFVQSPAWPRCPGCGRRMAHLLSLDSDLPLDGRAPNGVDRWDWGSGGVANAFWCDPCRISAWTHACT